MINNGEIFSGNYSGGGYLGNGLHAMTSNSPSGNAVGSAADELAHVEVDYDMSNGAYDGFVCWTFLKECVKRRASER